jgi:hypothetical protein
VNSFTKFSKMIKWRSGNAPICDARVKISNPATSPVHLGLRNVVDWSLNGGGSIQNTKNKNEKVFYKFIFRR